MLRGDGIGESLDKSGENRRGGFRQETRQTYYIVHITQFLYDDGRALNMKYISIADLTFSVS